ncbi:MAG: hypothetical protein KTR31_13685 [Myxococcales bacterium]|nr:hypothetical protein [Myxococcales bacterium]
MNQRSVVWVALFGGVSLMLLGWLLLSNTDPTTEAALDRAVNGGEGAGDGFNAEPGEPKEHGPLLRTKLDPDLIRSAKRGDHLAVRGPLMARLRTKDGKGLIRKVRPAVTGPYALDSEGVAAAVAALQTDLDGCFKTARFHTPDLEGELVLTLTAEPAPDDGGDAAKITSVGTDAEQDAAVLEGCLNTVFADVSFTGVEPGSGATTIRYPVRLSATP